MISSLNSYRTGTHSRSRGVRLDHARYLYLRQFALSRSRNSRSMSDSSRFLIAFGLAWKRACSCVVTSAISALWSISFRDFMMRTIAA